MRSWSELSWGEKTALGLGKLRRFYLVHFRPAYVAQSLGRRRGQCDRTGACCNLLFACPLYAARPLPTCRINRHKPKVCRTFPIDERDLRERDIISPEVPCGFSFAPPPSPPGRVLRNH